MSNDAYLAEIGEVIETDAGSFRLRVEYDPEGTGNPPEEYDNHLGTFVAKVAGYDVPCESSPKADGRFIAESLDGFRRYGLDAHAQDFGWRTWARYLRRVAGARVVLPIYSTGPDARLSVGRADERDNDGVVGLIYDTPEAIARGWGAQVPDELTIARNLKAEVENYTTWACGEMTGYIVEWTDDDPDDESAVWSETEDGACWGFYSVEEARETGKHAMAHCIRVAVEQAAQRSQRATDDEDEIAELRLAEIGGAV